MDFGWEAEIFDVSTIENGGVCGTLSLKNTRYLVRVLPSEDTFEMSGTDLSYNGLDIRLDSSLTSQLLLLKKL